MIKCRKIFMKSTSLTVIFVIVVSMLLPGLSVPVEATDEPIVTQTETQTIDKFKAFFVSGAENKGTDSDPDYVWTANKSNKGHRFKYQIAYSFSGTGELPVGAVEMIIPKHILKDRSGQYADDYEIAVPEASEVPEDDEENEFVYIERENDILIYNRLELSAAQQGSIQFSYSTNKSTFEYVDMRVSDDVSAVLNINKNNTEHLHATATADPVKINTSASLGSVSKKARYRSVYNSWNTSWGQASNFGIENPDDYFYYVWDVDTTASATQPYTLTFDDTVTGDHDDISLVGIKFYGSSYSTALSSGVLRNNGDSYITHYVITKHLKSSYPTDTSYQIKNTVNVTLHPIDGIDPDTNGTSSATFTYTPPREEHSGGTDPALPIGRFSFGKYPYGITKDSNYYYNYVTANYELDEFYNGYINDIHRALEFNVYLWSYSYPWTIRDNYTENDFDQYGVKPLTFTIIDEDFNLQNERIDHNDFEISSISYKYVFQGAVWDTEKLKFVSCSPTYNDEHALHFYAKFADDEDWTEIGIYHLKSASAEKLDDRVRYFSDWIIHFKDNAECVGYKVITSNSFYYTELKTTPYCKIKHSERVDRLVTEAYNSGRRELRLKNKAYGTAHTSNIDGVSEDNLLFSRNDDAIDKIIGYEKESSISKTSTYQKNDKIKKVVTVGWSISLYEKYMSQDGMVYIPQGMGVFYDLIPLGGDPDLDTIEVKQGSTYLKESQYEVSTIVNYRNSGRVLLIVRLKENTKGTLSLTYATKHTWESLFDFGMDLRNSVAFETGNERITGGFPDNGGQLTDAALMNDLDIETNDRRFIYTSHTYRPELLFAVSSGLYKRVKAAGSSSYTRKAIVHPDQIYSYYFRFANDRETKSKNIVLFDNLENYSNADQTIKSLWKGTLFSVDVSQLKKMGAAPVIYLSENNVSFDGYTGEDLSSSSVWKTLDEFGDISNAKAIAIDVRKDKDGNDFVLEPDKSLAAVVYLKAPKNEPDVELPEGQPIRAYNDIYCYGQLISAFTNEYFEDRLINWSYDTVDYRVTADVPLLKLDDSDRVTPVPGISFRLNGTSAYGTDVDMILETDYEGKLKFKDVEKGIYELTEYKGSSDYLKIEETFKVEVKRDGTVYINDELLEEGVSFIICDTPRIHTDISFNKRDEKEKTKPVVGAKFCLSGTSDYGNDITLYGTSDENGIVTIEDVEMGSYELVEVEAPANYNKNLTVYRVVIDENRNYSITPAFMEKDGSLTIYDVPLQSFVIQKEGFTDLGGYSVPISGAVFHFSGTTETGEEIEFEKTTQSNGKAVFEGLKNGTYVLYEVSAPEGYICNPNQFIVKIDNSGVTIDGLTKNTAGEFVVKDKEDGNIIITKKWVDKETNDTRTAEPTINVGVEYDPMVAYFDKGYRVFYDNNSDYYDGVLKAVTNKSNIKRFVHYTGDESTVNSISGKVRIDDESTDYAIYAWYIDRSSAADYGTVYWWSNASKVYLTDKAKNLWQELTNCTYIDTSGIDTSKMTNMSRLFYRCSNVTRLDVSTFDTLKVTDMSGMFSGCNRVTEIIGIDGLDTVNVTDMSEMFSGCSSLENVDLSGLDLSNVTDVSSLFSGCTALTELDLSDVDLSKVTTMSKMFYNCSILTSLDMSGLDISSVTDMSYMFYGCRQMINFGFTNIDTSNVTDMSYMFCYCSSQTTLDLTGLDTSSVTDMSYMFDYCTALTSLDVSGFDTSKVTNMAYMFALDDYYGNGRGNLLSLDLSSWDTSSLITMDRMFFSRKGLKNLYVSNFDTSKVTSMVRVFGYCTDLESLDLSEWVTSNVTYMSGLFYNCRGLTSLDISNFVTSNVNDMSDMFYGCSGLTSLDISNLIHLT